LKVKKTELSAGSGKLIKEIEVVNDRNNTVKQRMELLQSLEKSKKEKGSNDLDKRRDQVEKSEGVLKEAKRKYYEEEKNVTDKEELSQKQLELGVSSNLTPKEKNIRTFFKKVKIEMELKKTKPTCFIYYDVHSHINEKIDSLRFYLKTSGIKILPYSLENISAISKSDFILLVGSPTLKKKNRRS